MRSQRTQWMDDWRARQTTVPGTSITTPAQWNAGYAMVESTGPNCDGVVVVMPDGATICNGGCDSKGRHRPERVDLCTGGDYPLAACVCRLCRPPHWNHPEFS